MSSWWRSCVGSLESLPFDVQRAFQKPAAELGEPERQLWAFVADALRRGLVRAAEPDGDRWRVNVWVKQAILVGFRVGVMTEVKGAFGAQSFFDKDSMLPR